MKMDDETLKRILQEGMEYDADCIMKEVNSDPNLKDVVAPEDMHANIKEEIERIKAAQAQAQDKQAQEEQELIRLGKIYKKKRARNKYIILIAAVVCALGVGTISFGDGKNVFTKIKRALGDRQQTVVNSGDEDKVKPRDVLSEEEAFEEINEKFGFYPVKMLYMPEGIEYKESAIQEELQNAQIYYAKKNGGTILYYVSTNYRNASTNIDVEDKIIEETTKKVGDTSIVVQEYFVEEDESSRWMLNFVYKEAQYSILLHKIEAKEIEKVIENLYFS